MKVSRIISVIFILLVVATDVTAQAPGYLGKKFLISYDMYTMPALSNPNAKGKSGITAFNFRQGLSFDWVTGLRKSAGVSLSYSRSQFEFKRIFEYTYLYRDSWSGDIEKTTSDIYYPDTKGELWAVALGIHTHMYFENFLAPLGTYFKPEILIYNYHPSFDSMQANDNLAEGINKGMITFPNLENKGSYYSMALGATIGTHYIFSDRLVFNIGFQFGWVVGGKKFSEWMESDGFTSERINEGNFIPISTKSRLWNQYLMNINAGLGILIF